MSNIVQPCSCLSVKRMKIVSLYSPNVSVLSSGKDALSQYHRTFWYENKRVIHAGNLVRCNAAVIYGTH